MACQVALVVRSIRGGDIYKYQLRFRILSQVGLGFEEPGGQPGVIGAPWPRGPEPRSPQPEDLRLQGKAEGSKVRLTARAQ